MNLKQLEIEMTPEESAKNQEALEKLAKVNDEFYRHRWNNSFEYVVKKYFGNNQDWFLDIRDEDLFINHINKNAWSYVSHVANNIWFVYDNENLKNCLIKLSKNKMLSPDFLFALYYHSDFIDDQTMLDRIEDFRRDSICHIVKRCKNKTSFEDLLDHSNSKIRLCAFESCNINDHIDKAIEDSTKDIRTLAIEALPFGHPKLKKIALKEKAAYNLRLLATKLAKDDLIFLIGKSSKSQWGNKALQEILKLRLQ